MIDYLVSNWDGWPLHVAIVLVLMHPYVTNSYPWLMFAMHCVFWPMREAWQHGGIDQIWELHQVIEWGAPVLAAGLMLVICLRWPYHRKR